MKKTVGIAGLGLIGGSMAKAMSHRLGLEVYGYDLSGQVLEKARALNDIAGDGEETTEQLDMLFIALYPQDTIDFVKKHWDRLKKGCVIIDFCGVKEFVCQALEEGCRERQLVFIGGHPMAGREFSGFDAAQETLFDGASMILVPTSASTESAIRDARQLFLQVGFKQVVETTARQHDQMIAFTSQLAHVTSNAYIKSPQADRHQGYSAGSYKDLTRVARLNPDMWTELFLRNRQALSGEIKTLIGHLSQYLQALERNDETELYRLLQEGSERKQRIDQRIE